MLDSLDVINYVIQDGPSFDNHAAKTLDVDERVLYLKVLALVMSVDKKIREEEERYFMVLFKSLALNESELPNLIRFAQRPDTDTLQAFFRTFRRSTIAQLFLFDALMLTRQDEQSNSKEKEAIDKIVTKLEMLKGTQSDVYDLFCHIKNRNWRESAVYFSSHLLIPKYFQHLLSYFEIDLTQLESETTALRQERLRSVLQTRIGFRKLQWGTLEYRDPTVEHKHTKITQEPVKGLLSFNYAVMVPFLRSLLDRRLLRFSGDIGYLKQGGEEVEALSLQRSGLMFDPERENLYKLSDREESTLVEWELPLLVELLGLNLHADLFAQLEQVTAFLGCSFPKIVIQNNKYHLPRCDGKLAINRHPLEPNGNIWSPVAIKGKKELGWVGVLAERGMDDEWPTIRWANGALEEWEEEGIGVGNSVTMAKNECKQGPNWATKGMDPYNRPWYIPSKEAGFNFHPRRQKCLADATIRTLCRNGIYLTC